METTPRRLPVLLGLLGLAACAASTTPAPAATSAPTAAPSSAATTTRGADCDLSQCNNRLLKYYQELGCAPVSLEGACCPSSFDCSSLSSRNRSQCHYRGKAYGNKAHVDHADVSNPCIVSCECQHDGDGRATFTCVSGECPDVFGPPLQRGCVRLYEPGECCSSRTHCEDSGRTEEDKPLFRCLYGGKSYVEGEYIYSDDSHCKSCICQQGFNGSLDGPWCRELSCDVELHNGGRVLAGCAPIYYGDEVCCPVDWRCPASSDSVLPAPTDSAPVPGGPRCQFGALSLRVGERLSASDNPCVSCSCSTPPHVSCQQVPHDKCSRPIQPGTTSQPAPSATTRA